MFEIISLLLASGQQIDFLVSTGNLLFDDDRIYGSVQAVGGNNLIDLTGAVDGKIVIVYHNDTVDPSDVFVGSSVTVNTSGEYQQNVVNILTYRYQGGVINKSITR